jgi:hypothetical protein
LLYLLGQRRSSDQRDRGPADLCVLVLLAFPTLAEKALILALLEIELESYELRSLLDALGNVGILVCNGGAKVLDIVRVEALRLGVRALALAVGEAKALLGDHGTTGVLLNLDLASCPWLPWVSVVTALSIGKVAHILRDLSSVAERPWRSTAPCRHRCELCRRLVACRQEAIGAEQRVDLLILLLHDRKVDSVGLLLRMIAERIVVCCTLVLLFVVLAPAVLD